MATVDKAFADNIAAHEGYYNGEKDDNARVVMIVEYTTLEGSLAYGIVFEHESLMHRIRYLLQSEFIFNPRIYWILGGMQAAHTLAHLMDKVLRMNEESAMAIAGKVLDQAKRGEGSGGRWVPFTPKGTPCTWLASQTEDEAWAALLEDAKHMPYGTKEAFIKRGYTVEKMPFAP